jgi:2-dehydropantoate 2-reductase
MRYVVYGAGAVGGGIGGKLAQAGKDVVLIARGDHLRAMQADGLRLRTPREDVRVPVVAVGAPSEVDWRGDEVVLLTMKTQDTIAALDALRDAAGSRVPVFCAQNGVENERMAARRFEHVYATLVQMPTTHLVPGEVQLFGAHVWGNLDTCRYPSWVDALAEQFCRDTNDAGFESVADPEALEQKYAKLLFNLNNIAQALFLPTDDPTELVRVLREEGAAAMRAAGIRWTPPERARQANFVYGEIPGLKREGGSTWQSVVTGRSLETDYLNGEIVMLGRVYGVPTPGNLTMLDIAAKTAAGRLQPGWITPEECLAQIAARG